MIFEVHGAEASLGFADLRRHLRSAVSEMWSVAKARSSAVSCSISETPTESLRFSSVEQPSYLLALFAAELKLLGKLQDMQRAGIAVELRGERQAHAAAGVQIRDLLGGQRFDVALLVAGIRRVMLALVLC